MAVSAAKIDDTTRWSFEIAPSANPTPDKEREARLVDPGFGRIFTDHMAIVRYDQASGWQRIISESKGERIGIASRTLFCDISAIRLWIHESRIV